MEGSYVSITDDPNVIAYLRSYKDRAVLVVLNMSASQQKIKLDLGKQGFAADAKMLATSMKKVPDQLSASQMTLEPYGAFIGEITKSAK
jgi:hypothetical protein